MVGTPRGQLLCLQPSVGVGTFTEFKDQTGLHRAVRRANRVGCRLFDTASMYDTEEVMGSAFRDGMKAGGDSEVGLVFHVEAQEQRSP